MTSPDLQIFLDRSVGTRRIAEALRELELDVETIRDRYGEASSTVQDVVWIEEATSAGRVLIGADKRIRFNLLERQAICRFKARCIAFTSGAITAVEMIRRLTQHMDRIRLLAAEPGPFFYHLGEERMQACELRCDDLDLETT